MEYANFGRTGMKVSRLCLGMMTYGSKQWRDWVLDEQETKPFIRRALDAGINFFDTADVYSEGESEKVLGSLLKHFSVRRENVVVATKVFNAMSDDVNDCGLSRKHILDSIDKSLQRLQMDYVDLYQIHRWDYRTPIEETLEALNDVVRAGKARYIGGSSMFAWQFMQSLALSEKHQWAKFVSMQNHYNLVYREEEREMIPLCIEHGIGLIPWSPMARGFFAGDPGAEKDRETKRAKSDKFAHNLYYQDNDYAVARRVGEVAKEIGATGSQTALAWVLNKPYITSPIIGASKLDHLDQAIAALDIRLSEDQMQRLEEPYEPHAVRGHS